MNKPADFRNIIFLGWVAGTRPGPRVQGWIEGSGITQLRSGMREPGCQVGGASRGEGGSSGSGEEKIGSLAVGCEGMVSRSWFIKVWFGASGSGKG